MEAITRSVMTVALLFALTVFPIPGTAEDTELARGIRQVKDGDLEGGLLTLDTAVREFTGLAERSKDLTHAYLYMGIAYLGLGEEPLARARFRQALVLDGGLKLSAEEFSRKVIRVFEATRASLTQSAVLEKEAKKKRGKGGLILLGAGGVVAASIAVAVGKEERHNAAPLASISVTSDGPALVSITRLTFTATASDPDGDSLAYHWDFGDRSGAEGSTAIHLYTTEGVFNVILTVSDGLASTTASTSVTSRALTGRWRPTLPLLRGFSAIREVEVKQEGIVALSRGIFEDGSTSTYFTHGAITEPRNVVLQFFQGDSDCYFRFTGQVDAALQSYSGVQTCGNPDCPCEGERTDFTLLRQ